MKIQHALWLLAAVLVFAAAVLWHGPLFAVGKDTFETVQDLYFDIQFNMRLLAGIILLSLRTGRALVYLQKQNPESLQPMASIHGLLVTSRDALICVVMFDLMWDGFDYWREMWAILWLARWQFSNLLLQVKNVWS
jgi:hypothetical protein